ncbi:MAG: carboxypeptidase regulatory-like domain-containing protein [Myxococcales bacterium]|nr:carboxypeptidase regulatory-like domain-containing protein [Myxococcales bacterium]
MNRRSILWGVVAAVVAVGVGLSLRAPREAAPLPPRGPAPVAPPSRGALVVTVTSAGAPVARAKVALAFGDDLVASGESDEAGEVSLGDLAPGRLRLIVGHNRHMRQERQVDLPVGSTRVSVELPAAAALVTRVEDPLGRPLAGATVRVVAAGERERGRCETPPDGRCEVGELEPGAYVVHAFTGRHRPGRGEVRLEAAGTLTEHTVRLEAGRVLSGRVVDEAGAVVPGARVGSSDEGGAIVTADEQGRFELTGLGDAPVNVFATAEGFAPRHVRALRPGSANVELRLQKPASLEARVTLASEAKSLMVSVCEYDTHFSQELCVARRLYEPPEGEIVVEGLPSGTYELVLEASGHHQERVRIQLSPDRRTDAGELSLRATR